LMTEPLFIQKILGRRDRTTTVSTAIARRIDLPKVEVS
jgi:hypothetical protein